MSATYPLRLFLDCSTAHLSPAARAFVEREDELSVPTPFGWFVWAGEEPADEVPPDLAVIMAHARARGAEYILFDRDADEIDDLPTFDWST